MIVNYIRTAWRNIVREKWITLINIIGLSIGIASCILIALFVKDEISFDRFHLNSDNIYRVYIEGVMGNNQIKSPFTSNVMAGTMKDELSDVEFATRFYNVNRRVVKYDDKSFTEKNFYYGDEDFFKVFSFNVIKGDSKNLLKEPNTIVITESTAAKYFGNQDPIGKIIQVESKPYKVNGVCKDVPQNAHFHFDLIASISSTQTSKITYWVQNSVFTYFKLKENTDVIKFEEKLNQFVEKYVGPEVVQIMGIDLEEFVKSGNSYGYKLQPIEDIHLKSNLQQEIEPNGNISTVYYFTVIAIFILLIACINFMNLATARYSNRAKEVGVRKVIGSSKRQLITQFFIESIILSSISLMVAVALVEISLPLFNKLTLKYLTIAYFSSWWVIPMFAMFACVVGILAGMYPSFILSSFKPVKVLKGNVNLGFNSTKLRSSLVVFQFIITIVLFVSTFIVYSQINYVTNKDLGFSKDQTIVIRRAYDLGDNFEIFKQDLLQSPLIKVVSTSTSLPGCDFDGSTIQLEGSSRENLVQFAMFTTDYDFKDVLNLKISDGRYFSKEFPSDSNSVVINQIAAKKLGLDNPIGHRLIPPGINGKSKFLTIIGVLNDFNIESLHTEIKPLCVQLKDKASVYLLIKLNTSELTKSINLIKETYSKYLPDSDFEYFFIDDNFEKKYNSEKKTATVFSIFSLLAIIVASLGLYGLSSFSVEKRTKEIGIRKALGASFMNVIKMFYKEILLLLILSTLIAWPIAYYLMNSWLQNFIYKIELSVVPFLLASLFVLIIAVLTVGSQIIKSANTNPADAIHYE